MPSTSRTRGSGRGSDGSLRTQVIAPMSERQQLALVMQISSQDAPPGLASLYTYGWLNLQKRDVISRQFRVQPLRLQQKKESVQDNNATSVAKHLFMSHLLEETMIKWKSLLIRVKIRMFLILLVSVLTVELLKWCNTNNNVYHVCPNIWELWFNSTLFLLLTILTVYLCCFCTNHKFRIVYNVEVWI